MQKSALFWLWLLLVVQVSCATFFVFDAVADWSGTEQPANSSSYHALELLVALALFGGLLATILQIRALARRHQQISRQLDVASGAFAALIEQQFDDWQLSTAERDVALLAIKGLAVAEIATLRHTKVGTIKAQCAAVYRKAGVTGRLQLLSFFIEELLAEPLLPAPSESAPQTSSQSL